MRNPADVPQLGKDLAAGRVHTVDGLLPRLSVVLVVDGGDVGPLWWAEELTQGSARPKTTPRADAATDQFPEGR